MEEERRSSRFSRWMATHRRPPARPPRPTGRRCHVAYQPPTLGALPLPVLPRKGPGPRGYRDPRPGRDHHSPRKRALIHGVLEEFINEVKRNGATPSPNESWSESDRELLLDIADASSTERSQGVQRASLFYGSWRRRPSSRTWLPSWRRTLDSRRRFGVSPLHVEARFGIPDREGESWPLAEYPVPGVGTLRFRGIVDRVDVDPSRKTALVLDYKTGRDVDYKGLDDDPVDRGRHLQLPVYALALRRALGEDIEIRAAYWFISSTGRFRLAPTAPPTDHEIAKPFQQTISTVVTGIRDGVFPANPGVREQDHFANCRFCDFDSLCLSRRTCSGRVNATPTPASRPTSPSPRETGRDRSIRTPGPGRPDAASARALTRPYSSRPAPGPQDD